MTELPSNDTKIIKNKQINKQEFEYKSDGYRVTGFSPAALNFLQKGIEKKKHNVILTPSPLLTTKKTLTCSITNSRVLLLKQTIQSIISVARTSQRHKKFIIK